MNISKQELKIKLLQFLFLTAGSVIFAVGIHFFRVPNSFVVGGASGLSIIFAKLLPEITVGQFVTIINGICIVFGLLALGKTFSWKTVYCSLVYSVAILILEKLYVISSPLTDETFLELIFSVILYGMLGDAAYEKHWNEKKELYRKHCIVEGENLIVSQDSRNGGIDSAELKSLIEKYLI